MTLQVTFLRYLFERPKSTVFAEVRDYSILSIKHVECNSWAVDLSIKFLKVLIWFNKRKLTFSDSFMYQRL